MLFSSVFSQQIAVDCSLGDLVVDPHLHRVNIKKILIIVIAVIYFISPVDLLPGILVDDLIVIIIGAYKALSDSTQQEY